MTSRYRLDYDKPVNFIAASEVEFQFGTLSELLGNVANPTGAASVKRLRHGGHLWGITFRTGSHP